MSMLMIRASTRWQPYLYRDAVDQSSRCTVAWSTSVSSSIDHFLSPSHASQGNTSMWPGLVAATESCPPFAALFPKDWVLQDRSQPDSSFQLPTMPPVYRLTQSHEPRAQNSTRLLPIRGPLLGHSLGRPIQLGNKCASHATLVDKHVETFSPPLPICLGLSEATVPPQAGYGFDKAVPKG